MYSYAELTNTLRYLYAMTKPTICLLVVVTVVPSVFMAAESTPNLVLLFFACFGAGLCSASAAVFNQLVEADVDEHMNRTKARALPSGQITKANAMLFGLALGFLGFSCLYFFTKPLAAWVALAGHIFYVLIYTVILKPRTVQNIVIGGAAGAVGPLIGWASVSNTLAWPSWALFLLIFLWTPPHFWALAIRYKEDYAKASIPMYPVVFGEKNKQAYFFVHFNFIACR